MVKVNDKAKRHKFVVAASGAGERIDRYLARQPELALSRAQFQRLIRQGNITCKGVPVKSHYSLRTGDQVEVTIPEPTPLELKAEDIPLEIIYEDDCLLLVNKPAGMVVHPAAGNYSHTMVNALLFHIQDLSTIGGELKPGIVHRLDKNTSGVLMVAKNDWGHQSLSQQLAQRRVTKVYLALVCGKVAETEGTIEVPIGRDLKERKKMSPRTRKGRDAITFFQLKQRLGDLSLLEVRPKTGRTHQIRVHLASKRYPIFGDKLYGGKTTVNLNKEESITLNRPALHAWKIGFFHPQTNKYLQFTVPLPEDMLQIITRMETYYNVQHLFNEGDKNEYEVPEIQ